MYYIRLFVTSGHVLSYSSEMLKVIGHVNSKELDLAPF